VSSCFCTIPPGDPIQIPVTRYLQPICPAERHQTIAPRHSKCCIIVGQRIGTSSLLDYTCRIVVVCCLQVLGLPICCTGRKRPRHRLIHCMIRNIIHCMIQKTPHTCLSRPHGGYSLRTLHDTYMSFTGQSACVCLRTCVLSPHMCLYRLVCLSPHMCLYRLETWMGSSPDQA
jgi:hypothetical protein